MRIGGPMSRVPGEPMTSYMSRRRRLWTLVREMDNTLELGDTVQGSMMLEQAGLSRLTAITEALLEQHYDVHHRVRETPTPTGNLPSPNRWRRRDTTRAYLAEAEPIKELTDITAYGEEGISDDYDGEQDDEEDDEIHQTDFAALLGNSGEDPEADDALAEALQLDAVAMVAWQRFNGKGKSKGKEKVKGKGKGKNKGNNLSLEERKKRLADLKSRTNCQACGARGHWAGDDTCPKNAKNESTLQSPARAYLTIGSETSGFDLALTGDEMSFDATAWSPMHASMPVTFLWRHLRKHRQVRDDRGNHRVLSLHRLHRHLSALEDVKNTVVEVRTQRLNVSLVWIADSSPPGARRRRKTPPCVLMLKLTRGAVPRLWCDTLAKRA